MGQSTSQQRQAWKDYECNPDLMTVVQFGRDRIRVAPPTADAWRALAMVMQAHGYDIRLDDTDSYNCRTIKGTNVKSLHSYGIALDVNWHTNPLRETPDHRKVRFSSKPTQRERGDDVKLHLADTDMTVEMIDDIRAIRTRNGKTVFEWGGHWDSRKDTMHFEIDVTPHDLETGIDWTTVKEGAPPVVPADPQEARPDFIELPRPEASGAELELGAEGGAVKALQTMLASLDYPVGKIDGVYGKLTRAAVMAFQDEHGLAATGNANMETMAALAVAKPRELGGERKGATVEDLRSEGSQIIALTDWLKKVAMGTGLLGALGISDSQLGVVTKVFEGLKVATGTTPALPKVLPTVAGTPPVTPAVLPVSQPEFLGPLFDVGKIVLGGPSGGLGALTIGAAFLLWRNAQQIADRRLRDHREGKNLGK